jgi:importin subunit alpha-1
MVELLPKVIQQLSASAEWDVRKEAAWVISNIATSATHQHIMHLVEHGVIQHLCDLLSVGDVKIILITLEALEAVLKSGESQNSVNFINLVHDAGGADALEKLQEHENQKVYERAVALIEKYLGTEEEASSENIAPASAGNVFSFGIPTTGKASVDFAPGNKFMEQQLITPPVENPFAANYHFRF